MIEGHRKRRGFSPGPFSAPHQSNVYFPSKNPSNTC
jgi:hypothetical protein